MATPVKFGKEFLINTMTKLDQDEPSIAGLMDGRFIVTWTDDSAISGDTSESAVRAQIYNADGSKSGSEFVMNTTTSGTQNQPTITDLDDGRFVASWTDNSNSNAVVIRAQIFNANGSKSGPEIVVSAATGGSETDSDITELADGRFVVTWTDSNSETGLLELYSQVFKSNGGKLGGAEFVGQASGDHYNSSVTTLSDGRYIVTWEILNRPAGGIDVMGRIFNANGSPAGSNFVVNTRLLETQDQPDIAALKGGRFVAVWVDKFEGNFEIRAQLFDDTGAKVGLEIVVNTPSGQTNQSDPAITVLASGQFVVTWTDESQAGGDSSLQSIKGQLFNANGSTSGAEFLINTTTTNVQYQSTITALADGRFVVGWSDFSATGGDKLGYAVRGQIFDPREAAVNLKGTTLADQWVGTRFNDKMSGAAGNDQLRGETGIDTIGGGIGNDRLLGGNGNDKLTGGIGRDTMTGGNGEDDFIFASAAESRNGANRDVITDFEHLVDDIDLSGFMAGGDYIGAAAFGEVAGQVRYTKSTGILQGDVDGDGTADFEIELTSKPILSNADFIF